MPLSFRQRLSEGIVLFDGAMGTMLYKKGAYLNQCYEAINLAAPQMVRDIHAEYVRAGCDVVETNTFGANRYKLKGYGLEAQVEAINRCGVELARQSAGETVLVAGSVGPLGVFIQPRGPIAPEEAKTLFTEQCRALLTAGVDLIVLESFADVAELRLAVEAIRLQSDCPIVAQGSFDQKGETQIGTAVETFICEASTLDVDVVGFNCSTGPADMLSLLERTVKLTRKPLACQPNAGLPRLVEGRNLYLLSTEYMAEYAKRFIQTGAGVVGGCCGTAPKHIRAMHAAIRALFPGQREVMAPCLPSGEDQRPLEAALAEKSPLGRKMHERTFVVSVEITPPRSADAAETIEKCRLLKARGIDAVNIPDGPRASARLSPQVLAILIQQQVGLEAVLHYTCRDRNLIGIQSDLLGLHAAGVRNLLIITGDPPKMGDYPDATAVFDLDSIGLVRMVTGLNRGVDFGGNALPAALRFVKGVGVNPGALNLELELERLRRKLDAGAEFIITQPVFDPEIFLRFREKIREVTVPLIAGIWPLVSYKNAEFMNNEVPGASVPAPILERMRKKDRGPEAQHEGARIAGETLRLIRDSIDGVQVSAALGKVDLVLEVLNAGDISLS